MMAEADNRMPDWDIWRHVGTAKLWEFVALSLNIEPRKVRHHPQAWMTGGPGRPPVPVFCEAQSFKDRWFLARRALGNALEGPLNPAETTQGADAIVNLGAFVRWARSVDWKMPPEMENLASDQQSARSETIAAENRCCAWLVDFMKRGGPEKKRSKYEDEAKSKFGIGRRAFSRAWSNAVTGSGNADWSKPGRKSRHRIDTPA